MSYKNIIRMFENRREKLQDIIDFRDIENEHKLRIAGAIDEIEFLLTTLRQEMGTVDAAPSRSDRAKKETADGPGEDGGSV